MKMIKMTFEVEIPFYDVTDEQTFEYEYSNDAFKLCSSMVEDNGLTGWYEEEPKLIRAEIL